MTEVLVGPDVEQALCDWLPTALSAHGYTVPVGTRVPNPRPASFVRLMVVGGGGRRSRVVQPVTVVLEGWAATESQAAALTRLAFGLVISTPDQTIPGLTVYRVEISGGVGNLPDPSSNQSRYTATVSLAVRVTAI